MMGMGGFNALQIILASGFPALTELGRIPVPVERLASLPEPVLLVRADERINFKLASNLSDPIRSDMAVLPLLVRVIPDVVVAPDYFLAGSRPRTFQLLRRVVRLEKYPTLTFMRLLIKFVPSSKSGSGAPELWLTTVVLHSDDTAATYIRRGTLVGA